MQNGRKMVEQYLTEKYNRSKFPYTSLVEIINKFGEAGRDELNKLKDEGKIRSRIYVNGRLIELIVNTDFI